MARRNKKVEEQMDIFEEGGLKDEGGTVDPVSGNDVPSGSTQSEVRDDIPAQLSEGEFVFPADVVRYIGLENLMELRQKAKTGLQKMEDMGQMGNSEEAIIDDDMQFDGEIDRFIEEMDMEETQNFAIGGMPQVGNPLTSSQVTPVATQPTTLPNFSSFVQQPARQQAEGLKATVESKEFIGPNGERVTIQFVNGRPATPVPDGYREMTAEEKAEAMKPKIEQPKISQEDSSDDRERSEAEEQRMAKEREFNETLSKYSNYAPTTGKAFVDAIGADPFMTGKFELPQTAIGKSLSTLSTRTDLMEELGKEFGLNMNDYKNKAFGFLPGNKYDRGKFMADLEAATYERQFEGEVYSDEQRKATRDRFSDNFVDTGGFSVTGKNAKAFDPFAADRDAQGISKSAVRSFEEISRAAQRARAERDDFRGVEEQAKELGFDMDRGDGDQNYGTGSVESEGEGYDPGFDEGDT